MGKASIVSNQINGKYTIRRVFKSGATSGAMSVWCADLSEGISGDVGLIEVNGEQTELNIQPGYNNAAAYNANRDGICMKTEKMTPAQAFYNLAMFPGWQKWKPTYKYATINTIDYQNDTASVAFISATSSQQNLNINQKRQATDVPIEYMDCDSLAFNVGDTVLVRFEGQSFSSPMIIGFKDNPQPCTFPICLFVVDTKTSTAVLWNIEEDSPHYFSDIDDYPVSEGILAAKLAEREMNLISLLRYEPTVYYNTGSSTYQSIDPTTCGSSGHLSTYTDIYTYKNIAIDISIDSEKDLGTCTPCRHGFDIYGNEFYNCGQDADGNPAAPTTITSGEVEIEYSIVKKLYIYGFTSDTNILHSYFGETANIITNSTTVCNDINLENCAASKSIDFDGELSFKSVYSSIVSVDTMTDYASVSWHTDTIGESAPSDALAELNAGYNGFTINGDNTINGANYDYDYYSGIASSTPTENLNGTAILFEFFRNNNSYSFDAKAQTGVLKNSPTEYNFKVNNFSTLDTQAIESFFSGDFVLSGSLVEKDT